MKNLLTAFFALVLAPAAFGAELKSPDGKVVLVAEIKHKLDEGGTRLYYSLLYNDQKVILDSPIALELKGAGPIADGLTLIGTSSQTIKNSWTNRFGKNSKIINHCNELTLSFQEQEGAKRKINIIFRAYNDGLAFRYQIPEQEGLNEFELVSERTEFVFSGNHQAWAADYNGFASHQESEFEIKRLNDLVLKRPFGLPMLIKVSNKLYCAVTEANLTDWAGMYVQAHPTKNNALITSLSPRHDDPEVAVRSKTPRFSPWRVIMIGEHAGNLIESNMIYNLNEAVSIDDSWVKPGISSWDYWWPGAYAPDQDFEIGMNTATMKYFVDLSAAMGWEYQLVDWRWYGEPFEGPGSWIPDKNADITTYMPELDLPGLIAYAKSNGVGIILWLHWEHALKQMDEAFALYEKWGVKGVKIDFMARDDQEMVNFYHTTIKKAAQHKLLVDFHGAYKPTGISRTYPNMITREGVLGNEYSKWSERITPDHCTTLPYTRMLAGQMDFTPGGFRHATKTSFKVASADPLASEAPMVMGTRCYQLAMLVVFDSPLQVICDSPYNYKNQPGTDLLKIVPTVWDETRFLAGEVGDYIVLARRKGKDWFIGAMNDWTEREISITLDFIGNGKYNAEIWEDAPECSNYPDRLNKKLAIFEQSHKLKLKLAPGGGQVVHLVAN